MKRISLRPGRCESLPMIVGSRISKMPSEEGQGITIRARRHTSPALLQELYKR